MIDIKLNEMLALAGRHLTYGKAYSLLFCGYIYFSIKNSNLKISHQGEVSNHLYNNIDLIRSERINSKYQAGRWHYA